MSIVWQQRIQHFDRPVKPTKMRGVRLNMLKSDIREKRGYPSGGHSSEYVFASLQLRIKTRRGDADEGLRARLEFMRLRERMLERKRRARRLAQSARRPSVTDTKINLAIRRRKWLAEQDEMRARWETEDALPGQDCPDIAEDTGTSA